MTKATESSPKTPVQSEAQADAHLAQLHKMSTTAGVTNLDYVAVNLIAIVALVLGMLSAMALLDKILLVVPLAGLIFAIVALKQINNSGGTQTGKILAIAGLALCLLFAGVEIFNEVQGVLSVRDDEKMIDSTLAEAGKLIHDGKFNEAYALFDDSFHSYVKPDQFQNTMIGVQKSPLGTLESIEGNHLVQFESAGGTRVAGTKAKIKFAHTAEAERFDVALREINGKWKILRFPFFQEPKPGSKNDVFNF
jgi:hypothetical protein